MLQDGVKKYSHSDGGLHPVLGPLTLTVRHGEFVALVGPSGCGKTTLLRVFAGLEPLDSGSCRCCGNEICDIPPHLGYVFQQNSLFPWLNARDNVAFGLRMTGLNKKASRDLAQQALVQFGLQGSEDKYPHQLSGGMRQKVAIARTMINKPRLLLLDEPFGAVDMLTKQELDKDLRRFQQDSSVTTIMVTHDLGEALRISDRIVVLGGRPGKIMGEVNSKSPDAEKDLKGLIIEKMEESL